MRLRLLAAALAVALLTPAVAARASDRQRSIFEDDGALLYAPPASVARTLGHLRGLGVQVVKAQVTWRYLAPSPDSRIAPSAGALESPGAYSSAAWRPLDTLVRLASAMRLRIFFSVGSPAPDWAGGAAPTFPTLGPLYPSPRLFGAFVHAVALRYSGHYRTATGTLPRVSFWSIWNEPNQAPFLRPQSSGKPLGETSPSLYRGLARAGEEALRATGHEHDTILIGELASEVSKSPPGADVNMAPLRFLRALYCVGPRLVPLRGRAATRIGCPADAGRALRRRDPELFESSGLAIHPYALYQAPEVRAASTEGISPADLGRLGRILDRIFASYGVARRLPIYVTEFGYKTKPPNPFGVSLAQQAAYVNRAELLGYEDARVRSWAQFQLTDQPPIAGLASSDPARWASFQSGLRFVDGAAKPALAAYRLAFAVLGRSRRGGVTIWGHVRPYRSGGSRAVLVQIRDRSSSRFRALTGVRIRGSFGFLDTHVGAPAGSSLRLVWRAPGGAVEHSRIVHVATPLGPR